MQENDFDDLDPIIRDIIPYCSNLKFIKEEYEKAVTSNHPAIYLDGRIKDENGSRSVDLRILQSRLQKQVL